MNITNSITNIPNIDLSIPNIPNIDLSIPIYSIQWENYLYYFLFFILIIIICIYLHIKSKYGFWVIQPVFHIYDIGYMISPPGIINTELPEKNKYTNFLNIETIMFENLSDIKLQKFLNVIRFHYLRNQDNMFIPKKENIVPYFQSHNNKSFISFYYLQEYLLNDKTNDIVSDNKIIGVITSRPIHINILSKNKSGHKNTVKYDFDAYYVDYLCVDYSHRKQGIAPQLIQTHEYNYRRSNKNISVSLFKREDELTGIVPLCVYSTYGFPVLTWSKPADLTAKYKIMEITEKNFHLLVDFLKEQSHQFDIVIQSDYGNIMELLKTKNMFIICLLKENVVIGSYFFKKSCIEIEKGMEVLSCFASIHEEWKDTDNVENAEIFVHGFKISFWKIANDHFFGFSAIEELAHNNIIIQNIKLKTKPLIVSPTAYFFYNYAYPTFPSNKVFIIN